MRYWLIVSLVLVGYALIAGWHVAKPLPSGVDVAWTERTVPASAIHFLADRTYVDEHGQRHSDQQIFDEVFRMIEQADRHLVADMFLYNDWQATGGEDHRALTDQFTDALIARKQQQPDLPIIVITDPINTAYGGAAAPHLDRLRGAGINVIVTDLKPLRDSNPIYAALWRVVFQWWGNNHHGGWLPHPFQAGGSRVTARTWLQLLNFKANHRKVVIADDAILVTSANPHDGSSAHSNIAVKVDQGLAADALASEAAVARFSGAHWPLPESTVSPAAEQTSTARVQLLTEAAIKQAVLDAVHAAGTGDEIAMTMFYISDHDIINALVAASHRGATIRLALDPNKDAFGHVKIGVPNRPVANELIERSGGRINIRWCDTHGEQCHSKLLLVSTGTTQTIIAGSANFTRRNLDNYNLETNILVTADSPIPAAVAAAAYIDDVWHNRTDASENTERRFTVDYDAYRDRTWWKNLLYRWQESTGMSSF